MAAETTFDATQESRENLLREMGNGKIQPVAGLAIAELLNGVPSADAQAGEADE